MTAILRTALLAALATASVPAVAAEQDTSTTSLLRRIELLERAPTSNDAYGSWSPSSRVSHRKASLFGSRPDGGTWRTGVNYAAG